MEALDRRIFARKADVRDAAALKAVADEGVAELSKLDIVSANAGICTVQTWDEVTPAVWQDTLDTNLTGVQTPMVAGPGGLDAILGKDRCVTGVTLPVDAGAMLK